MKLEAEIKNIKKILVNDENFGQLFISDTSAERTEKVIKKTKQSYKMFTL